MAQTMNILLDVATCYFGNIKITDENIDTLSEVLTDEYRLGYTKDGIKITAEPNVRQIEFDGRKERNVIGMDRVLGWNIEVEAEALNILDRLEACGLQKVEGSSTKYEMYRPNHELQYNNLILVGQLHNSNEPAVIQIENVYNSGGLTFEQKDADEASFGMKFTASYNLDSDEVPLSVFRPKSE